MAGEGLPEELRALGRALEGPPPGGPSADGVSLGSAAGVSPEGGETVVERVLARIVGLPAPVPVPVVGDRIREEQWWRPLPGLEAGQGPVGGVSRSADRGPDRPPSARRPRP